MQTLPTHRISGIAGFVVLMTFVAALQTNASGATIILKNGQEIVTEKFWEKDDSVSFYYNDLIARIPRDEIDRIEKDTIELSPKNDLDGGAHPMAGEKPEDAGKHSENRQQTESLKPSKDTTYLSNIISAISKSKKHVGYRDLFWGCSHLDIYGLKKIGEEPDFGGIEKFVDTKEPAKFGNADVNKTIYRFWNDKLISITMWADGEKNYAALKDEAFERFGRGRQGDVDVERYIWLGGSSDRYLEFDENIGKGLLWFRYRELWQQIDQHEPPSPPSAAALPPLSDTAISTSGVNNFTH